MVTAAGGATSGTAEPAAAVGSTCRGCGAPLSVTFVDLGLSPLANSYVEEHDADQGERFYPLHVLVCERCLLVQLPEVESPQAIFSDYAYFASYSESWLAHARDYAAMAVARFGLGASSRVVEIASNDGYLLRWFAERGIPVLGIEAAANVAAAARELGIESRVAFFGAAYAGELVAEGIRADLLVGNNVLAHVPALGDFVTGLATLLAPRGVLTMEFPHLLRLMAEGQFDTIYHEHFSYFSLAAVRRVFADRGLELFDVEELPTHGGSLRIYARHTGDDSRPVGPRVATLLAKEEAAGLLRLDGYRHFGARVAAVKRDLLRFLLDAAEQGKTVVGYGAPAKGNTLLNYCGVRSDLLAYTVDRSPHKQGRLLPGTRIPIHSPHRILDTRPDYVLILPWNLKDEVMEQMAAVRSWGGRFVVAVPRLQVL
ncbi:MAG TPA: class I SAM-dependent methyltransferase [Thermoanaerobaculia bacterium]|nr:class I SAM-dependent methyltransferase [Thermoanaerobaculia bacterium]